MRSQNVDQQFDQLVGKIGLEISRNNCLDLMAPDSNNRVKNSHGVLWSSCQINDILIKHRALKIFLLKRLFWFNIFYLGSLSIKEYISYNLTPLSLYGHIKQRITLVKSQTSNINRFFLVYLFSSFFKFFIENYLC